MLDCEMLQAISIQPRNARALIKINDHETTFEFCTLLRN